MGGLHEQDRLVLLPGQGNLMHRSHAVCIRGAEGNQEITLVHHPQINMHCRPVRLTNLSSQGARLVARVERPAIPVLRRIGVFFPVIVERADFRLVPGVQHVDVVFL